MSNIAIYTASPAVLWRARQAANVSPSVTPSISVTPSNTPEPGPVSFFPSVTTTVTPSISITPTVTPTITPTPSPCNTSYVQISNSSKGTFITAAEISANSVTYVSGDNFNIGDGQSGLFSYSYPATQNDLSIYYDTTGVGGDSCLTLVDCNSVTYTQTIGGGLSDKFTFTDIGISCGCTLTVTFTQGACP